MRSLRSILLLFFVLICAIPAQADWSLWQEYTTISAEEKPFITLEVRNFYSRNWPPRAQWRATNRSKQTLYCAQLGKRVYILSHGRKEIKGPQGCRTLASGETAVFLNDTVGRNGDRIHQMSMDVFSFDLEKGKNRQQVPL
ncbi:hypothetical protein HTZ97_02355 [Desulfuromonas acetoxidans]|uniref:Uncharacterized protein n=1 Tax=Desulfuromonas acetoxidans (strain DSM 684 / 11070) TaxID=281689 RepID=Q1JYG1_DESA6|nr:hypothetical protein [Desulfuromonas acetoxidans]EAT15245.1 hypothetical protein Dace_1214 [Desulfuromonas acetoxidans DSM 684]MBF0645369.1 hypothetical protein [Desulfuromonas acetoxidans]NVD23449.1 hypothetical protein [Desulfuromonas acetoxidans]NVE15312.1 hypothetical protein [Desulfuromonas acetoxidans]